MSSRMPPSLATLLLLATAPLAAQTVVGTVTDRDTNEPVVGALVVLLDEDDRRRSSGLSNDAGRFIVHAPDPGPYRLRVERIGYESITTAPIEVPADIPVRRDLAVPTRAITLEGLTAEADRRCTVRPADGLATARVWEEARKALAAARWTREAGVYRYRVVRYERLVDRAGLVESDERVTRSGRHQRPFRALAAAALVEHGFVQEAEDGGRMYYAPDANVLLSDVFLDTHCMRLTRDDAPDEGLIGLAFEPVGDRGPPDVRGALWLDRETAELRSLEYRYLGIDVPSDAERIGGRMAFERVPGGGWIVRRWMLRMPHRARQYDSVSGAPGRIILIGFKEEGGEVVNVTADGGEAVLAPAGRATLAGVVWDSTRSRPLAGAVVYLSGTIFADTTDAGGRFRLEAVPEGIYAASVHHRRLETLGAFPAPQTVELRPGDTTSVRLAAPGVRTVISEVCADSLAERRAGMVAGIAVDPVTGGPVPGAVVAAAWSDWRLSQTTIGEDWVRLQTTADERGIFRICGVPAGTDFRAVAHPPGTRLDDAGGTLTVLPSALAAETPAYVWRDVPADGLRVLRLVVRSP